MRSTLALRPLVALAAVLVLAVGACGDDDSSSETLGEGSDGPMISIDVDDTGWTVSTSGFVPETGDDVPIAVTNNRSDDATVRAFLAPEGYAVGDPLPDDVDLVIDETLASGADEQIDVTFDEAGDYAVLVDPVATGDLQRLGGGFTIGEG